MTGNDQVVARGRSNTLLLILIVAIISFVAGARSDEIFTKTAQLFGLRVDNSTLDLSSVQEAYQSLKANYDGEIDTQALIYGASKGMVEALGDPHTAFLDPDGVKELNDSLSGNIGGGIGAEIGIRNDQPAIIRPLKNSPAMNAGVQAGDAILLVNDELVADWTVDQVVAKIRGEVGTKVRLTLRRGNDTQEVTITREQVVSPTVEASISEGIGLLTVSRFNGETAALARTEAEKFVAQGVSKVILDLRGNPGGEVSAAQGLAGLWLDDEIVLTQRRGSEVIRTDRSTGKPILGDIKTVVLINSGSASASEIVAGALKDYGKATLVGEKTYGKGSVQAVVRLSGGAELKVTESRWFTPKGKNIDQKGIEPDTRVELRGEDLNNGVDPQMERARQL